MNPFDPAALSDEEVRELLAVDGEMPTDGHTPPEMRRRLNQDLAFAQRLRRALGPEGSGPHTVKYHSAGATPSEEPPATPTTLGRFAVRRELGRGGFGIVFLAYDPLLNREVAVKVPRAQVLVTPDLRERFHREARAAAGLEHPNLVPVYEAGEAGEVCFLVSAYCPGTSLDRWLRERREPVPFGQATALVAALAGAMQHAHERGVIHRDLKPANILLTLSGGPMATADGSGLPLDEFTPRITDFGLAKFVDDTGSMTQSGTIVGTASYMAPEQAGGKSKEVGAAADVYALGCILYELLTRRPPFQGDSDIGILLQVRNQEPIPPARLRPQVPRDLETICLKCLEKDVNRRYVTAAALAADLRRFLDGNPIQARPVGRVERLLRWGKRNPALAVAGGLAALLLAAVIGLSLGFAFYEAATAETLRRGQQQTQQALEAQQRATAMLILDRGISLCEQGQIGRGLLWFSKGLEESPDHLTAIRHALRANLATWHAHLDAQLATILPQSGGQVAISPDGKTLMTSDSQGIAVLRDANSYQPLGEPLHHETKRRITIAEFSPDSKTLITVCGDGVAHQWDVATRSGRSLPVHTGWTVTAFSFHPNGKSYLTVNARGIHFWDTETARTLQEPWTQPNASFTSAIYSPDGATILTGSSDRRLRLHDSESGKLLGKPLEHKSAIVAVAISKDGQLVATGSASSGARIWDLRTGDPISKELPHPGRVSKVAFRADGRQLLTLGSHTRLWEVSTSKSPSGSLPHPKNVNGCVFYPTGRRIAIAGQDDTTRIWELNPDGPSGLTFEHHDWINSVAISPDGAFALTAGFDAEARLWNARTGQWIASLPHDEPVTAVAISPNGKVALTGSYDRTARLWEIPTGNALGEPLRMSSLIRQREQTAFSPDGRLVVIGTQDGTAQVWDVASGTRVGDPLRHERAIGAVAFHTDSRLVATVSYDGTAQLWDAATGKPHGSPLPHDGAVIALAFRPPDGKHLLTGTVNHAQMWEVATSKPVGRPLVHQGGVRSVAFSPTGGMLVTGSMDFTGRIWTAAGDPVAEPLHHAERVRSVAFSPDGTMVLTGSFDHTARLWDVGTGRPVGPALRHQQWVLDVAFALDGRAVLTGSEDRTARLWPVPKPVPDESERLSLWIQVLTGLELTDQGVIRDLDTEAWFARQHRLQQLGGPPQQ